MWNQLEEKEQIKFKEFCDNKYGKTIVFSESKEPLYFDKKGNKIDNNSVIRLLFSISKN